MLQEEADFSVVSSKVTASGGCCQAPVPMAGRGHGRVIVSVSISRPGGNAPGANPQVDRQRFRVDDDSMDNSSTTRNAHNNPVPW